MKNTFLDYIKQKNGIIYINNILIKLFPSVLLGIYSKIISEIIADITSENYKYIFNKSIVLISTVIIATVISIIWEYITSIRLERSKQEIKLEFYRSICKQDVSRLNKITYGEGKERVNDDLIKITDFYMWEIPNFISAIITVLVYIIYIGIGSFVTCVTLSVLALLQCIAPIVVNRFLQANYKEMREVEEKLTNYVTFSYTGFETIKMYCLQKMYLANLKKLHKKYARTGIKTEVTVTVENIIDNFIDNVLSYGCYAILAIYVMNNIIDIDISAQVVVVASAFFTAYKNIFNIIPKYGVCQVARGRIEECLQMPTSEKSKNLNLNRKVSVQNAVIRDGENRKVLDIDRFDIDLSRKNILWGVNGSGKSTFIKLILKEIECKEAEVTYGNVNIKKIEDSCIAGNIFYLSQKDAEIRFTPQELYINICADNAERVLLNAMEFGVKKELLLSEKIKNLSLGNRRKVFLALALAQTGKCLILDEPSNHLDIEGIKIFKEKIQKHMGGFLIISHNQQFHRLAEFEYEVRNGKIYECN